MEGYEKSGIRGVGEINSARQKQSIFMSSLTSPTDQEVLSSLMGYSLVENYSTVCTGWALVSFVHVLSYIALRGDPVLYRPQIIRGPQIISMFLNIVHRNFLLQCISLQVSTISGG